MSVQPQTTISVLQQQRQSVRQHIRLLRQHIPVAMQTAASNQLVQQVLSQTELMRQQHFALYLANDAELPTAPLITALWQAGKQVYLPVLHPFCPGYLLFLHYEPSTTLSLNRFGIAEPQLNCASVQPVAKLDVIFTPLVAFDQTGNRLGMGGGFYDRTLSQLNPLPARQQPQIVGLAYACQQVAQLPAAAWDQPLDSVITPQQYWQFTLS
jgi:5-formyltetrahydrofolate cyclo-ligase